MKLNGFSKFSSRIDKKSLEKLEYIAIYNCRSKTQEVEFLIKQCVRDFENKKGKISYEDLSNND